MPSEAKRELDTEPERLALQIIALRAYARVKAEFDAMEPGSKPPRPGPMLDRVKANTERFLTERTNLLCPSTSGT